MRKDEFLNILDRKLQVINEKERRDIIDEYRTHIEMKMEEGKSEEEAIEDFGDIDELVDEILDAYKINTNRVHGSFDAKFNTFMDELFNGFKRFLGSFTSLDVEDVVKIIFEIFIMLVLLAVLRIPFQIVSSLGASLLRSLVGFGIGSLLAMIWRIIIGIAYVVIFVVVLVNLCTKRLQRYRNRSANRKNASVFDDFKDSFDFDKAKQNVHNFANGKDAYRSKDTIYDEKDDRNYYKEETIYDEDVADEELGRESHREYRERNTYAGDIGSGITSVATILMKIFFCLLMIPFVGIIIALCCTLGAMIVLSIEGVTLIGAYLLVIGGLVVAAAFLSLLHRVLWRKG